MFLVAVSVLLGRLAVPLVGCNEAEAHAQFFCIQLNYNNITSLESLVDKTQFFMKTKLLFFCLCLSIVFGSCKKEDQAQPVAAFTFLMSGSNAPVTVAFTNGSQNATSYAWDFGDGVTSSSDSPSHTYNTPAIYTVTLEAKNSNGKTNTCTAIITVQKEVLPLPQVMYTFTGNGSFAPCFVNFNNTTQNAATYLWSFGDGTSSTEQNPKHLYTAGGTYNVILTAKNADDIAASLTKQVTVTASPTKVNIKQITLTGFPATMTNGGGWDSGSGPDPYYEVSDYPSGTIYYTSSYFSDLTVSSLPKTYAAQTIILGSVDNYYQIKLYDNDIIGSEFMGGYYFKFRGYMPTNGDSYPSQIYLGSSGVTFKVSIEWKP